jgi:hypothetical protein
MPGFTDKNSPKSGHQCGMSVIIVEEYIEEGRELPAGDRLVMTEGTAVAVTQWARWTRRGRSWSLAGCDCLVVSYERLKICRKRLP